MFNFKLLLSGLLMLTCYGLVNCKAENTTEQQLPLNADNKPSNVTLQVQQTNNTNSRSARTLVSHSRTPAFTLRRRQPIQIRARADHLPLRTQMRRVNNGLPNGQQPQPQNIRMGFESLKSSKFMPHSKAANSPYPNNGKGVAKRPQILAGHPNAIHVPALSQQYMHNFKASPVFNGQVKVHAMGQTQKQQTSTNPKDNNYPKYVKPQQPPASTAVAQQAQPVKHLQLQHQQQKPSLTKYPDFKQYPIPDQEKMQQHNEQHEKYLHQQKFLTPKNPIAYYQLQHTQQHQEQLPATQPQQNYPVQQPLQYLPQAHQQQKQHQPTIPIHESVQNHNNINNVAFPAAASVPPKMYSVYEDNDMAELQTNNYQPATYQGLVDKEAQEYLRFMNSDEYFLPRKEPNYKRLDDEADKRQFNIIKAQAQQHLQSLQQAQAAPTAYQQQPLPQQQKSYLPQVYTPSASAQGSQYTNSLYNGASDASIYQQDHPISRLFYQQDPTASASASASSTVVRTSYQTGYNQNQFVVNSQDNKVAKYTMQPSSTTIAVARPTQPPPVAYPQLRHNTAGNRTPEPLRFEFTERDAMVGSYSSFTNAPQAQLMYKELVSNNVTPNVPRVESSTQNYLNRKQQTGKSIVEEGEDDPEDGDDMQGAGNNLFGRQSVSGNNSKVNKVASTTEALLSEQQDTEEYCERICAIVEDENEEIVCGSDGYMYTSEAQMECYASCLHIDVTIQAKGSCAAR